MPYESAVLLSRRIRERQTSAVEVLEAHLAQISRHNPEINAVVTLDEEGAMRRAREADAAVANGDIWGPLHGVPMTLKDGHSVAGMRTTAGWEPLSGYIPAEDGTVAAKLKAAGAIIMGKTNVPVLLGDWQSNNPIFGRTRNPWNLDRTPGGSSGGAAAALAAGMTPLEIGSDLGGSVRIPAAFCGLFGLKPTEHRVSLFGHIPSAPGTPRTARNMASIGPLARTIEDLKLGYHTIAGAALGDTDVPPLSSGRVTPPALKKLRIAWTAAFPGVPVARSTRAAVEQLATTLDGAGARVEERLPAVDFAAQAELYWSLFDFVYKTFAPPQEGEAPLTAAAYFTALERRDELIRLWERFFSDWDVLICPVSSVTAFPHCEPGSPLAMDGRTVEYYPAFAACYQFNLTGAPSLVLPVGQDEQGLPIGVQVVTKRWADERLLAIGERLTETTGGFRRPAEY